MTNVEKNSTFAQYVQAQQGKVIAAKKAIELRYQHKVFNEREQRFKELKYKDKILRTNIAEMCAEDCVQYGPLQKQIRSCQTSSFTNYSTSLN